MDTRFKGYFIDESRKSKKSHIACHNMSQNDVTITLRPILAVIMVLTNVMNTHMS